MATLTKASAFRGGSKWGVRKVDVPELGDPKDAMVTYVGKLSSRVLIDNDELFNEPEGDKKDDAPHPIERLAKMCSLAVCNKKGELLFGDDDVSKLIDDWPFPVLVRCAEAIVDFNGLNEPVEDKAKNLPASRPASSPTGSRKK